jgi:hypothetical protein
MLPAAAQAQYPYDWHAATPPSWFAESTDSSCQPREQYLDETVYEDGRSWSLLWASPGAFVCFKPIPPSPELGPGIGFYCEGTVSHTQIDGSPDDYLAVWSCSVGDVDFGPICTRNSHYAENPLGDPDEAYNYDSGGWYDPYTGGPYDCRPEESVDGGEPGDNSACERAKQKVKKAKKKVGQADTRAEKTKAKNKLKKAKQKKKEACVTPARPVTD